MTKDIEQGNIEIRTLGFYQPFCSLMFHGKLETRWVRKRRKPPFPLGQYLFYSTKNKCENPTLYQWCGADIRLTIEETLAGDVTRFMNRTALGVGTLENVRLMTIEDEPLAFVKFIGEQSRIDKHGDENIYVQWILEFKNVTRFDQPFAFIEGKQGIGKYHLNTNSKEGSNHE